MKRKLSIIIALIICLTTILSTEAAFAAVSWPSISSSKYCEYTATKTINVYRNTALKTRGTSSPAKSYSAYISKNDVCRIYKITASYTQINYPTSNGRRTGYVSTKTLFNGKTAPVEAVTSKGKVTTYVAPGGKTYGNTVKGDKVYACGTSSGYTAIIYTAKSGKRAYKYGWVKNADYISVIKAYTVPSPVAKVGWQYPMKSYSTTQNFGRKGHLGIDIKSSRDSNVYAAADGKVVAVGLNGTGADADTIRNERGNGYYVVIEHNLSGRKVYSMYGHLKARTTVVRTGQTVKKGARLATYGNTGNSTGRHLHFAIANKYKAGSYYGYTSNYGTFSSNSKYESRSGVTFYNPVYVIKYNRLP